MRLNLVVRICQLYYTQSKLTHFSIKRYWNSRNWCRYVSVLLCKEWHIKPGALLVSGTTIIGQLFEEVNYRSARWN